ncbi:hypothetical protein KIPB_007859, partial [Kipferlia bialata]
SVTPALRVHMLSPFLDRLSMSLNQGRLAPQTISMAERIFPVITRCPDLPECIVTHAFPSDIRRLLSTTPNARLATQFRSCYLAAVRERPVDVPPAVYTRCAVRDILFGQTADALASGARGLLSLSVDPALSPTSLASLIVGAVAELMLYVSKDWAESASVAANALLTHVGMGLSRHDTIRRATGIVLRLDSAPKGDRPPTMNQALVVLGGVDGVIRDCLSRVRSAKAASLVQSIVRACTGKSRSHRAVCMSLMQAVMPYLPGTAGLTRAVGNIVTLCIRVCGTGIGALDMLGTAVTCLSLACTHPSPTARAAVCKVIPPLYSACLGSEMANLGHRERERQGARGDVPMEADSPDRTAATLLLSHYAEGGVREGETETEGERHLSRAVVSICCRLCEGDAAVSDTGGPVTLAAVNALLKCGAGAISGVRERERDRQFQIQRTGRGDTWSVTVTQRIVDAILPLCANVKDPYSLQWGGGETLEVVEPPSAPGVPAMINAQTPTRGREGRMAESDTPGRTPRRRPGTPTLSMPLTPSPTRGSRGHKRSVAADEELHTVASLDEYAEYLKGVQKRESAEKRAGESAVEAAKTLVSFIRLCAAAGTDPILSHPVTDLEDGDDEYSDGLDIQNQREREREREEEREAAERERQQEFQMQFAASLETLAEGVSALAFPVVLSALEAWG